MRLNKKKLRDDDISFRLCNIKLIIKKSGNLSMETHKKKINDRVLLTKCLIIEFYDSQHISIVWIGEISFLFFYFFLYSRLIVPAQNTKWVWQKNKKVKYTYDVRISDENKWQKKEWKYLSILNGFSRLLQCLLDGSSLMLKLTTGKKFF